MRIYTRGGDIAFKTFTFPDGQPHFQLETYEREFNDVTIETAIRSPHDLFLVLLVGSVLRTAGYRDIGLDIRYLLGARMDRALDWSQPFTLEVVARLINGAGFTRVRILDAHSPITTQLVRNSTNILPWGIVNQVWTTLKCPALVAPDHGATSRVRDFVDRLDGCSTGMVQCSKIRHPQMGALSGFTVEAPEWARGRNVLIVDDICDGGGTFVGLAQELKAVGALKVYLYVTHGIFSKPLPLEGIERIYTTDSYFSPEACNGPGGVPYNWDDARRDGHLVVIPVSMEKL